MAAQVSSTSLLHPRDLLPATIVRHAAGRIGQLVEAVLANPDGWNELSGGSWLDTTVGLPPKRGGLLIG
jgi:hypothetical protein